MNELFNQALFGSLSRVPFLLAREQFEQNILEYCTPKTVILHHISSKLDKIFKKTLRREDCAGRQGRLRVYIHIHKTQCDHVSLVSLGNWSKNIQNKHDFLFVFNAETFPVLGP